MNDLRNFCISFCVVCALYGGVSLFFPKSTFNKIIKLVLSLSFICSVLCSIPFVKDFELSDFASEEVIDYEETSLVSAKAVFETALKENNINFSKITLITDKNESGGIIITKVIVYTNEKLTRIKEIIGNDENYEVEVVGE